MGFRGLLRHQLAIVTPSVPDMSDLDEAGFPVLGEPTVRLVPGLVQPRDAHESLAPREAGAEYTDFLIFLEIMPLSIGAYITEADDDGPVPGGRRFQVNGIQPFNFGNAPHLEVYATLIGNSDIDRPIPLGS